jgi:hypothetical protein
MPDAASIPYAAHRRDGGRQWRSGQTASKAADYLRSFSGSAMSAETL